jgi:alpha-L-fucosidase
VKFGNIFSIDVGPDYKGNLRDIDVKTLKKVGRYIKGKEKLPDYWEGKINEDSQKK